MTTYLIAALILLCLTFALAALMQGLKAGDERFFREKAETERDEAHASFQQLSAFVFRDLISDNEDKS